MLRSVLSGIAGCASLSFSFYPYGCFYVSFGRGKVFPHDGATGCLHLPFLTYGAPPPLVATPPKPLQSAAAAGRLRRQYEKAALRSVSWHHLSGTSPRSSETCDFNRNLPSFQGLENFSLKNFPHVASQSLKCRQNPVRSQVASEEDTEPMHLDN